MPMKRALIPIIILLAAGMASAQQQAVDMSFYTQEFNRTGATVYELLDILRAVRDENQEGIGSFYNNAARTFLNRLPNFAGNRERLAVEECSRLLLRGIAAEKHTESAQYVWTLLHYFDIVHQQNDGYLMYEAFVAMGEIGAKDYATNLANYLYHYNDSATPEFQTKIKIHRVVPGIINALEALHEPVGVKPVFFVSIGWYDTDVKEVASTALPNIMDDPGEIISEIIRDPFNGPSIKNTAWQEMLRTKASNASKAKVAAVALETSYTFIAPSRESQSVLRSMRMSAIDTIRLMGIEDDSVYAFLERTYREAFDTPYTDFEVITLVVRTLAAVKTEEAVDLLTEFLRVLHSRRRSGPWGISERDIMQIIIPAIANTETKSRLAVQLLTVIQNSSLYTNAEQTWARNALSRLTGR